MSRRIAERMGYNVQQTGHIGDVALCIGADGKQFAFNPLHSDADAFAVLAKLVQHGTIHIDGMLYPNYVPYDDRKPCIMVSKPVIDAATLRAAIYEIADQVVKS